MTGLVGTTAGAVAGALAYYNGGMTGQTPVILLTMQLLLVVGVYVWVALALAAVFRKTSLPTWKAWVPVVNTWTLFTLAGMRGWWAVVLAVLGLIAAVGSLVAAGAFTAGAIGAATAGEAGAAGASVLAALLIPLVIWGGYGVFALILQIRMVHGVNRGFGLGAGYTVLGALLLPVWASIVGWGSSRWIGLPPAMAQPTLTAPPPPPPASPFTLGGTAGPAMDAASAPPSPAAGPIHVPAPAGASGIPAVPPPPTMGGNPWAPPAPPSAAPAARPAAPPVPTPVLSEPVAAAAPVTAAPVTAAPVAAAPVAATPAAPAAVVAAPIPAAAAAAPTPAGGDEDLDERTVLAARRLGGWTLVLPDGAHVSLLSDAAVLGRNPVAPAAMPRAQVVAVDDVTRTVSKTHALLHRADSGWKVTDLASTNGVFLADESEVTGTATVSGVFFLGDARLELLADA
ncbi:DUF5684 domain-containing protein [Microbacterium sp. zg-Y818]|uniref:DUF5684 domain-containing protein n=1 Tax=unclassified Microbacterium TaxID=2609290 RepID=UPI00214A9BA8|nr:MULTISPECIES: DUF5684 domain-containing protein [unclassified Microbacterium]MCR2801432.1 DUF5684 domain-containing protein [Microbacterium sp. zg.Y818]WIM21252.1 DUF5684 domain-containing protein [Microbacterium sp. zg-Y818]